MAGRFRINRDFGNTYNVAVPQEFEITLPSSGIQIQYPGQFSESHIYAKLQLIVQNKVAEALTLSYMKIPLNQDAQKRKDELKGLLLAELNRFKDAGLIEIDETKINHMNSICVNARTRDFFIKIVGFLNPHSQHSILATILIDPRLSPVKSSEDLNKKGLGLDILRSSKFGRELM